ncbi:MAG: Mce protein, partial [Mycobacterium sp.]|nr:Mce protein [Mycobacterium sp.]
MTVEPDEAENLDVIEELDEYPTDQQSRRARWRRRITARLSQVGWAAVAGVTVVALLAGLTGWLGYRAYERHQADARRDL